MAEIKRRAIGALALLFVACVVEAQTRTVAMTLDDLPFASASPSSVTVADAKLAIQVNGAILRAFTRHHIPATGFVIEQRAEQLGLPVSKAILRRWLRPGFDLGNHLYSHPDLNAISAEDFAQEVIRGEATFGPLLKSVSRRPEFLRFPYNHTGDPKQKHDAIAAFMKARGYRLAPCTIDNSDYEFNATYVLALARHDTRTAAKVRSAYIAYTDEEIDWYTSLNRTVFGYEPPHVMLLHDNRLNADSIEEILPLFTKRGYRFVALAEAMRDPAYKVPETYVTRYGPMWGYRWAQELHVKVNGRLEPEPPAWIAQYAKDYNEIR